MRNRNRIEIGHRQTWGGQQAVGIEAADRRQHVYVIGKTGTGKSSLLKNLIVQDIEAGDGVGLIDPHGDLALDVLDGVPPWRTRDVLYFHPADAEHPIGFNPLHGAVGDRRHLVASSIVSAFKNVWSDSWGPRLEYVLYATVASLACLENGTLLGIQRMLSDAQYRRWVVQQVEDPMVRAFWEREFASFDKRLAAEIIAPIQNKVGQIVMSPLIRNVVGQVKSRIDPRFLMDNRRIFIANLAKGRLGEDKANLLGSLLVSAFHLAAMGREDVPERDRQDWYLYVDEFQNFATDSFASILSEARKQRLCLTLAHQHTSQIRPEVRDSIFGNAGTIVSFRVSEADAAVLAREFGHSYDSSAFTDLPNYEALMKLLSAGEYGEPFRARMPPPVERRYGRRQSIIRRARESHATPRRTVEGRIKRWMWAK